jgi:hypothetical protein
MKGLLVLMSRRSASISYTMVFPALHAKKVWKQEQPPHQQYTFVTVRELLEGIEQTGHKENDRWLKFSTVNFFQSGVNPPFFSFH